MARTAFGDAFSRSFDSVVASLRRERESELADSRLRDRMKEERESKIFEDLNAEAIKEGVGAEFMATITGPEHRTALQMEIAQAKRDQIAGAIAGNQPGAGAVVGAGGGEAEYTQPSEAFLQGFNASKAAAAQRLALSKDASNATLGLDQKINTQRVAEKKAEVVKEWNEDGSFLASSTAPYDAPIDFRLPPEQAKAQVDQANAIKAFNLKGAETAGFVPVPYSRVATDQLGVSEPMLNELSPGNVAGLANLIETQRIKGIGAGEQARSDAGSKVDRATRTAMGNNLGLLLTATERKEAIATLPQGATPDQIADAFIRFDDTKKLNAASQRGVDAVGAKEDIREEREIIAAFKEITGVDPVLDDKGRLSPASHNLFRSKAVLGAVTSQDPDTMETVKYPKWIKRNAVTARPPSGLNPAGATRPVGRGVVTPVK